MQVSSLIQLYVDIEHTGRHASFHEKFETRHMIGQILREPTSAAWLCSHMLQGLQSLGCK